MLQNPIHLRTEGSWKAGNMSLLWPACANMYPNTRCSASKPGFGDGLLYRRILDLIWETLTVKDAKVNFDSQLEKLEERPGSR